MMVPLSGQDPPNAVRGKGSTIGFGVMKLLTSQDGGSTSALCMTTLSTTINLFQDNQSVLFTERKGDLSKTRVTEMPPIATRSKLKRQNKTFFIFTPIQTQLQKHPYKASFQVLQMNQCFISCMDWPEESPSYGNTWSPSKLLCFAPVPFCDCVQIQQGAGSGKANILERPKWIIRSVSVSLG